MTENLQDSNLKKNAEEYCMIQIRKEGSGKLTVYEQRAVLEQPMRPEIDEAIK